MTDNGIVLLGACVLVVYFVPSVVGHLRHHHHRAAICVLNLFLGFTYLGWVAALVWSSMPVREEEYE